MKSKVLGVLFIIVAIAIGVSSFYMGIFYREGLQGVGKRPIIVSTTTSLYQLGLLDDFFSDFKNVTGIDVEFKVLAKGSGEALRLLADGSACIAFVHAPSLELQYMEQGKAEQLAVFAYNEFLIVGPANDPADVRNAPDAVKAFERIYRAGESGATKFVSRGDMSGTNVRELQLWRLADLNPDGRPWYLKSGQGMVQTLLMAKNLGAYTLTDEGTFTKLKSQGRLQELVELKRDPRHLINVYSMYLSKASACDDPYTWYVAFKLRDYLMTRGQDLLASKYEGLIKPVRGYEDVVKQAWEALTRLG